MKFVAHLGEVAIQRVKRISKPEVTRLAQMRETWGVVIRSLPYRIGLKKARFDQ